MIGTRPYWVRATSMLRLQSSYCFDIFFFVRKQIQTYCFGMIVMLSCPLHRKSVIKSGLSTLAWHVIIIDFPTGRRCDCVGKISSRGFSQFTLSENEKQKKMLTLVEVYKTKSEYCYSNKLLFLFLFLFLSLFLFEKIQIEFNSISSKSNQIIAQYHFLSIPGRKVCPWMAMSVHRMLCQIENLYSIYFACVNNNDNG